MPFDAVVFECYGHGAQGSALVLAPSRAIACQTCFEWLGWEISVAFRSPERYTLWKNCGGTDQTPVVYARDDKHFSVLDTALPRVKQGAPDNDMFPLTTAGWEARYDR